MVTGRHVRLHAAQLVERIGNQVLGDTTRIDSASGKGEAGARDDVGPECRVLTRVRAIARRDIIDQTFVERPGIHLPFPIVNERVTETIDLALLIGNAGRFPGHSRRP